MEAIRIFLAFATYMNFKVYQMDVKSAFLNGKLKEEVYVKQPPGFESSEFPNYVCKLDKAFYGLNKAPRACPMCKISVQSKGITSNSCEKNPQVPERCLPNTWWKLVCWSAKKQQSVAMSSAEAEYVAAAGCCAMPLQYPTIQYFTQEPSILILDIISSGITSLKETLNYTSSH
ncbi:retrovirus-related pol polyprotein from transposon TNT 1-94 [Tanacetum coccineum]